MSTQKAAKDSSPKRKRAASAKKKKAAVPRLRTKLTPALRKEFCELVREGAPLDLACDYVGISNGTFYNWKHLGETWIDEGQPEKDPNRVFGHFLIEARKALAFYRIKTIRHLHTSPSGTWQREMTILERRDRKNFGRQEIAGGDETSYNPDDRFV